MMRKFDGVRPGILPNVYIMPATDEEKRIVHKFGKVFQIGWYREEMFKQVSYKFFFARPTEDFRTKFNLECELLVLFNDLPKFETRTFDFVDKLENTYRNRLDKICVVLISKDPQIVSIIRDNNARTDAGRIAVPFTYSELFSSQEDRSYIENRFRAFFYSRDLFDLDSPIRTDSFFYGRNNIVQSFYDKYSNSENSALFGLRKIGKTSVLYAIKRLCEQRGVPVVYIDCQSPAVHKKRWYETLQYLIFQAKKQWGLEISSSELSRQYSEKEAAEFFEKDLQKLKAAKNNRRILFIFDEIEHLTHGLSFSDHWKNGDDFIYFWQTIRSIFQSDRDVFSFVIAGVNPTIIEKTSVSNTDNPIFNIATPQYLDLFSFETVSEMVSDIGRYMGMTFDNEVFFLLHEDFGGHPFLTRIACSQINKLIAVERPAKISKFWYRQNRDAFTERVMTYVEQLLLVLKDFYPEEYSLLEKLAKGDIRSFEETISTLPSAGKHLNGYGIINTKQREYFFKLKIVEEYLLEKINFQKIAGSKEEKIAEVSRRRNLLEDGLKGLARVLLQAKYGIQMREKFLNAIPHERRIKIEQLPLEEILADHCYFLDLANLYVKEFPLFENIFDKNSDKFIKSMQHINTYRIDAHAKDIDEDDFQMLILEFNWLEKCLGKLK